jgi:hypothetical protein
MYLFKIIWVLKFEDLFPSQFTKDEHLGVIRNLGAPISSITKNAPKLMCLFFFPLALQPQFGPWPTSIKLSVHFGLLDLRQSVGLLGRVISSSQGLYLYINIEKRTHTNTKHPCLDKIRTHDPGFRASEDSACLRPLGYRDRLCTYNFTNYQTNFSGILI